MSSPERASSRAAVRAPRNSFALKDPPRGPARRIGRGRPHGKVFRPADPVRETGIYEVIHQGGHRPPHEAVMLSGDIFPSCDTCAAEVRFRLVRTAPYIFQDQDFEEPDELG